VAVADRAVLPVRVDVTEERFTPDVETTAYYVACEGLANALKHANATSAGIRAQRDDGNLVVEVRDDGIGGASVEGGSGLRHVADRVEAHGGRLRVESPAGDGTRVVGEIPCAS
jgi:signal transduction histidine kinase